MKKHNSTIKKMTTDTKEIVIELFTSIFKNALLIGIVAFWLGFILGALIF